jgi:hypothetical protein
MATTLNMRTVYEMRDGLTRSEVRAPGVSWGGVVAGAFVMAALSLVMLALGTGMGVSAMPLWAAAPTTHIGAGAVIWLVLTEVVAAAIGGYVAGRLRVEWSSLNAREVRFRDRVQGFLVWAVSLLIMAAFLATGVTAIIGGAVTNAFTGAPGGMAAQSSSPNEYFADALFRTDSIPPGKFDSGMRSEANLIMQNAIRTSLLPSQDRTYLVRLVSSQTGLIGPEAEKRVSEVASEEMQQAQLARSAAAHSLDWAFVALLIGAFVACHAATIGGKERDRIPRLTV